MAWLCKTMTDAHYAMRFPSVLIPAVQTQKSPLVFRPTGFLNWCPHGDSNPGLDGAH
ncbi:hypothetical protein RAHE111665_09690 [Rariglobus hedericola]